MTPRKLRALAKRDPAALRWHIRGARDRELIARHLILHPERIAKAAMVDLECLREYLDDDGWKSLYNHDRGMWRLLRDGVRRIQRLDIPGITLRDVLRIRRVLRITVTRVPSLDGQV